MERGLLMLVATLMVLGARRVEGGHHQLFSNLTVNVTRDGCGTTKLCVAEPAGCDPNEDNMCFLLTVDEGTSTPPNGTELMFQLAGYSMGFIALGLTSESSNETSDFFFCISENGTFNFIAMTRNNSDQMFSPSNRSTREIRGNVTGRRIRCEFNVPMLNATMTRSSNPDTTFRIEVVNGTLDGTGAPTVGQTLINRSLDLRNATSNIDVATTTMSSNMTTTTMSSNMTTTTMPSTTGAAWHLDATAVLVLLVVALQSILH